MLEQARLGDENGIEETIVQGNGDIIRLAPGKPERVAQVRSGRLVLDGDIIVPADGDAVTMRRRMARDGMLVVVLGSAGNVQIEGIGLPLDEDYDAFVEEAQDDVRNAVAKLRGHDRQDEAAILEAARLAARRCAQRWSGKKPQTRVIIAQ